MKTLCYAELSKPPDKAAEFWSVREVNDGEEEPGNAECAPEMTQELSSAY